MEKPAQANPKQGFLWVGDDEKGYFMCALVDGKPKYPIGHAVVPVNFCGSVHFEANIVTSPTADYTLPVKRLVGRHGMSLQTHDASALKPVPTAAEAKALCEANYARQ